MNYRTQLFDVILAKSLNMQRISNLKAIIIKDQTSNCFRKNRKRKVSKHSFVLKKETSFFNSLFFNSICSLYKQRLSSVTILFKEEQMRNMLANEQPSNTTSIEVENIFNLFSSCNTSIIIRK